MATMTKRTYEEVSSTSSEYDRKRRMSVIGMQNITHAPNSATEPPAESTAVSVLDDDNEEINLIIASLALPDPKLQVAVTNANHTSNTEVQAYAKLAGPTWTYYVQKLSITIGRASDPGDLVEIDLNPFKIVSRRHATIQYNLDGRYWEIVVLGRNGVRIDKVSHKQGSARLYSGNILDIGGVQMMFVLPDVTPQVAPIMRDSILSQRNNNIRNMHDKSAFNRGVYGRDEATAGATGAAGGPLTSLATVAAVASEADQRPTASNTYVPYPKGVAIVTRPQIRGMSQSAQYMFDQDLRADDAKDIKPPYSYATMITQAILSTEDMMMSLSDIYDWIASSYSFYRHSKSGWQNSIRHNLSLNKAFEKVPRKANEPGKGMNWQITAEYKEEFMRKANLGRLVKGRSSTVHQRLIDSPMKQQQKQYEHVLKPMKREVQQVSDNTAYVNYMTSMAPAPQVAVPEATTVVPPQSQAQNNYSQVSHVADDSMKEPLQDNNESLGFVETDSDDEKTVPVNAARFSYTTPKKSSMATYDQRYNDAFGLTTTPSPSHQRYLSVSQLEAYTPDRGSRRTIPLNESTGEDSLNDNKKSVNTADSENNTIGQSSSTQKNSFSKINTPMPVAPAGRLQLAPPSASQQLPSSFMPASSPAPFWKFMQMSSTPVRPGDGSPTKFSSPTEVSLVRGGGGNNSNADQNGDAIGRRDSSDDALGDLQDVDLTRGFRQIGNWRRDNGKRTPEGLRS